MLATVFTIGLPRIHIAITQVHTQPGFVEKLLADTRECIAEILKSNKKNDTPTVRSCRILLELLLIQNANLYL